MFTPNTEQNAVTVILVRHVERWLAGRRLGAKLARMSGVSTGHLSDLRRGRRNAALGTLRALCGAMGVEVVEVLRQADSYERRHGKAA